MNIGRNQKFHENGEDWSCENYKDEQKGNISFRIRSKYDDSGKLKEAYYGKIYGGGIEIDGDDKKGVTKIAFIYYFNPKPLDRNLEWDMKKIFAPVREVSACRCREKRVAFPTTERIAFRASDEPFIGPCRFRANYDLNS